MCFVVKLYRLYGLSQLQWGLPWVWYNLKTSFRMFTGPLRTSHGLIKKMVIDKRSLRFIYIYIYTHTHTRMFNLFFRDLVVILVWCVIVIVYVRHLFVVWAIQINKVYSIRDKKSNQ